MCYEEYSEKCEHGYDETYKYLKQQQEETMNILEAEIRAEIRANREALEFEMKVMLPLKATITTLLLWVSVRIFADNHYAQVISTLIVSAVMGVVCYFNAKKIKEKIHRQAKEDEYIKQYNNNQ